MLTPSEHTLVVSPRGSDGSESKYFALKHVIEPSARIAMKTDERGATPCPRLTPADNMYLGRDEPRQSRVRSGVFRQDWEVAV